MKYLLWFQNFVLVVRNQVWSLKKRERILPNLLIILSLMIVVLGITQAQVSASSEKAILRNVSSPDDITLFYRIAGVNFLPRDSRTEYRYYGNGCIRRSEGLGDQWFSTPVQLPNCATIEKLEVYYYDNSTDNNVAAELFSYDGLGNYAQIASVYGDGTPGYSSSLSVDFSHEVDNEDEALSVYAKMGDSVDNNLILCGVKLKYTIPASCNFLPICTR